MVLHELIILAVCATVFGILFSVITIEERRGERLFLRSFRRHLDLTVEAGEARIGSSWRYFTRYIVQLHWYYSLHSILRATLIFIQGTYTHFEKVLERNVRRTRALRREKRVEHMSQHLREIAEHKEDTSLTPKQKERLKQRTLEDLH